MKNSIFSVCLVLSVVLIFGCSKDEQILNPPTSSQHIDLMDLKVGQTNSYVRYEGEKYYDTTSHFDFSYTNDTIVMEIVAQDGSTFIVEESYTPGSEILTSEHSEYYKQKLRYRLSIEDNKAVIERDTANQYSTYFFYAFSLNDWGNGEFKMEFDLSPITENETEIKGWKTTGGYCECYIEGFADDVVILGNEYGRCNVITNNVPMQVDGNGMTYVYNSERGFVRSFTYSWWTGGGHGFDLLK